MRNVVFDNLPLYNPDLVTHLWPTLNVFPANEGHSPSFYDYEYRSLSQFPLEFMFAVSFVFPLFL